jgi:hypothetical protein
MAAGSDGGRVEVAKRTNSKESLRVKWARNHCMDTGPHNGEPGAPFSELLDRPVPFI